MKRLFVILVGFLVAGFFVNVSYLCAQTNAPGIDKRMENQEKRIDNGIESGALRPAEAARLEAQQTKIKQDEARMEADGKLTNRERARLHREQDRASRTIYRKKHNARTVPVQ
jgi:hypothetical protein